ncbi:MAG: hypothetical protein ACI83D_000693 [Planctomycetota bacterium]|jgi:hypothetical protein
MVEKSFCFCEEFSTRNFEQVRYMVLQYVYKYMSSKKKQKTITKKKEQPKSEMATQKTILSLLLLVVIVTLLVWVVASPGNLDRFEKTELTKREQIKRDFLKEASKEEAATANEREDIIRNSPSIPAMDLTLEEQDELVHEILDRIQ